MLLLALLVEVGRHAHRLRAHAATDEVVVRVFDVAHALDVFDVGEHEREGDRGGIVKAQPQVLDAGAQEELVPEAVEEVLVEHLPCGRPELLLGGIEGVWTASDLGYVLACVAEERIDVVARHHQVEQGVLGKLDHVLQHGGLRPVVGLRKVDVAASRMVEGIVARLGSTDMNEVEDADAVVALGHGIEHLTRSIG